MKTANNKNTKRKELPRDWVWLTNEEKEHYKKIYNQLGSRVGKNENGENISPGGWFNRGADGSEFFLTLAEKREKQRLIKEQIDRKKHKSKAPAGKKSSRWSSFRRAIDKLSKKQIIRTMMGEKGAEWYNSLNIESKNTKREFVEKVAPLFRAVENKKKELLKKGEHKESVFYQSVGGKWNNEENITEITGNKETVRLGFSDLVFMLILIRQAKYGNEKKGDPVLKNVLNKITFFYDVGSLFLVREDWDRIENLASPEIHKIADDIIVVYHQVWKYLEAEYEKIYGKRNGPAAMKFYTSSRGNLSVCKDFWDAGVWCEGVTFWNAFNPGRASPFQERAGNGIPLLIGDPFKYLVRHIALAKQFVGTASFRCELAKVFFDEDLVRLLEYFGNRFNNNSPISILQYKINNMTPSWDVTELYIQKTFRNLIKNSATYHVLRKNK